MTVVRDAAFLVGVVLVAVGAGMVFLPAGVIAAGSLLAVGAVLDARGRQDGPGT